MDRGDVPMELPSSSEEVKEDTLDQSAESPIPIGETSASKSPVVPEIPFTPSNQAFEDLFKSPPRSGGARNKRTSPKTSPYTKMSPQKIQQRIRELMLAEQSEEDKAQGASGSSPRGPGGSGSSKLSKATSPTSKVPGISGVGAGLPPISPDKPSCSRSLSQSLRKSLSPKHSGDGNSSKKADNPPPTQKLASPPSAADLEREKAVKKKKAYIAFMKILAAAGATVNQLVSGYSSDEMLEISLSAENYDDEILVSLLKDLASHLFKVRDSVEFDDFAPDVSDDFFFSNHKRITRYTEKIGLMVKYYRWFHDSEEKAKQRIHEYIKNAVSEMVSAVVPTLSEVSRAFTASQNV